MTLVDRVMLSPELREAPPVLVDVGAAGGANPVWARIARYSIGVGFEPDARDAESAAGVGGFKRWVFCRGLVAPDAGEGASLPFHLTRAPHCSSLLEPLGDGVREWAFAELFAPDRVVSAPAITLRAGLAQHGLDRVDWLKCDTQGLDLAIFKSLPGDWRERVLAVDLEPGIIDAYHGENKAWQTLRDMEEEPFWLAQLEPGQAPRGTRAALEEAAGPLCGRWVARLAPSAPVFVNLRYLRDVGRARERLGRREYLLGWVFADLLGQHGHALAVARAGAERFGADLFEEMGAWSGGRLRRALWRRRLAGPFRRLARLLDGGAPGF